MTYRALKYVATGLLTGDNKLPKEEDVLKALLGMALNYISNKCTVLNLMTLDKSDSIYRIGVGKHMQRRPDMPDGDDSELDIDEDGILGKELLAQYGEDCILEGETKSLMEKVASGDIGGSGTSLTTEQTDAIDKIEGLEASARTVAIGTGIRFYVTGIATTVYWNAKIEVEETTIGY